MKVSYTQDWRDWNLKVNPQAQHKIKQNETKPTQLNKTKQNKAKPINQPTKQTTRN